MRPYLFSYEVKPKADNPQTGGVGGAMATVIVFSQSHERALSTCLNYISEYGWISVKEEYAFELTQVQLPEMDKVLQSVYRKAENSGISAHFDAWPEKDRPGEHAVLRLQMPRTKKS